MSRTVNLAVLGLKAFTGVWALITLAVAAALQSKFIGSSSSVGAIIAAAVLTLLWVIVSLVLQFVTPESVIISVLVDTVMYSVLFVLALGGAAAESENADIYRFYSRFSEARLGNATIGLAWILVFLLLAIAVFQVYYTLRHHGRSKQVWLTPFHVLVADGVHRATGGRGHTTATIGTDMSQSAPQTELGSINHHHSTLGAGQAPQQPPASAAGHQV